MDSRVLNVVYDDLFDDSYVNFDNDTAVWGGSSETMGMQLVETLNGILPIAPTEAFHKDESPNVITRNAFNYEDFGGDHVVNGRSIEFVTVDPNIYSYESHSEDLESSEEDGDNDGNDLFNCEQQSQCSNATFRTRTDSSSIGDYESHTSDYDDDDDTHYENDIVNNVSSLQNFVSNEVRNDNISSILDFHTNFAEPANFISDVSYCKKRTESLNTTNSDVEALGLHIDANNFDLAEFITKDDIQLGHTSHVSNVKLNAVDNVFCTSIAETSPVVRVVKSQSNDSDSDSDVIVDIETVEIDENDASSLKTVSELLMPSELVQQAEIKSNEDLAFVDNVLSDPSWTPNAKKAENIKVEEKPIPQTTNFVRNYPLVPNKKQCDLLKGKYAKSKSKTIQKSTKSIKERNHKKEISPVKKKSGNVIKKIGIGIGAKNLSLIKNDSANISDESSADGSTPVKTEIVLQSSNHTNQAALNKKMEETPIAQKTEGIKRKLNLDEYKKRRGGDFITSNNSTQNLNPSYKKPKLESKSNHSENSNDNKPVLNQISNKHSEAVTSIAKTLREQKNVASKTVTDPITEAKNKVLRMQELKKAKQMRNIDSTISAKVPKVTKLLTLREIVKDTPYLNESENKPLNSKCTNPDYEEIIIISTSCNTDISIPPIVLPTTENCNNTTRSLLKSAALLTNTYKKVKTVDNAKLLTSSLIASIQDVVVKKIAPVSKIVISEPNKPEYYGEDKIIMHLRKDRIRNQMCSITTQTDLLPEFPPLLLSKSRMQHRSREQKKQIRKCSHRKRNDVSPSYLSEYCSDNYSSSGNSSTISRSRENSCSSSSAIGTDIYSYRSSPKDRRSMSSTYSETVERTVTSRRQRRTNYSKRSTAHKHSRSPSISSLYTPDSGRSRSPLYRRSRSRSSSRSRSRSNSPSRSPPRRYSYRRGQNKNSNFLDRNVSKHAVEERRIVYVGRIEQETTTDILRQKFLQYGAIEHISIHYKDPGKKFGFVTFERSQDAFAAIENGTKDPHINMYQISFGGRRRFCGESYADLDNAGINTYESYVFPQPVKQLKEEDSFEVLLQKTKAKLNANRINLSTNYAEKGRGNGSKTKLLGQKKHIHKRLKNKMRITGRDDETKNRKFKRRKHGGQQKKLQLS